MTGLWLAGNAGMEKKMESTIMGCIGTTTSIHSFTPSEPKALVVRKSCLISGWRLRNRFLKDAQ